MQNNRWDHMSRPRDRFILILLLLASLAFRGYFISQDMSDLTIKGPLYDDSFYCFKVAQNIASGHGSTFDGLGNTNGYQPLYVGLLVPLYWLSGGNLDLPIYLALIFSAILNVLTGLILYKVLRRFTSYAAAMFGLALWGFGPAIVRQALNGLETALAMFFIAVTLDYYISVYRGVKRSTWRQSGTLGALLALAVLARVDAFLFVAALLVDVMVLASRRGDSRGMARTLTVFAVFLIPWFAVSQFEFGSMVPRSGEATRFLSEAYAAHDYPTALTANGQDLEPLQLFIHNIQKSVMLMGTSPVVHMFTRGMERLAIASSWDRKATFAAIGGFLGLVFLFGLFIAHRKAVRRRRETLPSEFNFLYLYAFFMVAAYSLVVFGHIFFSRYYYPIFFFSILLGAFAFDVLLGLLGDPGTRRRRLVGGLVVALYLVVLPYMSINRLQNGNYRFVKVVEWIDQHTESSQRIGVFNCGAIGYYSSRQIVNLDGKVSPDALVALRAGQLPNYLLSAQVDYVIDHEWILQRFLLDKADSSKIQLVRVASSEELGVPGWGAYQVRRSPEAYEELALPAGR